MGSWATERSYIDPTEINDRLVAQNAIKLHQSIRFLYVSAFTAVDSSSDEGHGRYRSPHIHQDLVIVFGSDVTTNNLINAGLCVRLNTANCSH